MTRLSKSEQKAIENFHSKRVPTFIDGVYSGYSSFSELQTLEDQAKSVALRTKRESPDKAFAYVYAYFSYKDSGGIDVAHFYSGYPKTAEEYDDLSKIPNIVLRSIFSR